MWAACLWLQSHRFFQFRLWLLSTCYRRRRNLVQWHNALPGATLNILLQGVHVVRSRYPCSKAASPKNPQEISGFFFYGGPPLLFASASGLICLPVDACGKQLRLHPASFGRFKIIPDYFLLWGDAAPASEQSGKLLGVRISSWRVIGPTQVIHASLFLGSNSTAFFKPLTASA